MFCDLVGSTALSAELDAEDLREIVASFQATCSGAVQRFGGHVAQFLGDGVLAYFGYPEAHEDDAERAVRAALAIQSELAASAPSRLARGSPELRARIGIHVGAVVVTTLGGDAHSETLALGETVNLAARIEALAEPGSVVVSDAVLHLIGGRFETRDLGLHDAKGLPAPVRVHAVERASSRRAYRGTAQQRLIGRERELSQLVALWREARSGRGQVVLLSAEPGIGKSRLLGELRRHVDAGLALDVQCASHGAGVAFQPIIEAWERGLGFAESDDAPARLAKLENQLAASHGEAAGEIVPYLAALLGLPPSTRFPLPALSPELQRERTLRALAAPLVRRAEREPVFVAVEDVHWADRSTLEWIGRLIEQATGLHALVLLTYRPSFQPPWPLAQSGVVPLALTRLDEGSTRELIAGAAGWRLPEPVIDAIAERADGVPLFAEELTSSVIAAGVVVPRDGAYELQGRLGELTIPTTLQGSLMGRLDRLGPAKLVAQLGATIGRDFPFALIEAAAELDAATLRDGLRQLVEAEILFQRGSLPDTTYTFKHALLQDTAYESQLRSRRRELHARIAAALERDFPARVAAEPARMARHCAEGGLTSQAVTYFQRAGEQAVSRLAADAAAEHFSAALELLAALPEDAERDRQEVALRLAISGPLQARGYQRPETIANSSRMAQLCERLPAGPARIPALIGLATYNLERNHPEMSRWAEQLLTIVEPLGIAPLCVAAHTLIGTGCLSAGTIPETLRHTSRALEILEESPPPAPATEFEIDTPTLVSNIHGIALLMSGEPARAEQAVAAALRRADTLGRSYTRMVASASASNFYFFLESPEQALPLLQVSLAEAERLGFKQHLPLSLVTRGWARVLGGERGGLADVERGLEMSFASDRRAGLIQQHVVGAAANQAAGRLARAEELLQGAEATIELTGERSAYVSQVAALRAAARLQAEASDPREAERYVIEALEAAARAENRWQELKALRVYAALALRTGERAPVRELLAKCLAGFRDGFATLPLREGQRLLAALEA